MIEQFAMPNKDIHKKHASERIESFKPIKLNLKTLPGDEHYEISFNASNEQIATAYNVVIERVCKDRHIVSMHEKGVGNKPVKNVWELFGAKVAPERLAGIIDKIQEEAPEEYEAFFGSR